MKVYVWKIDYYLFSRFLAKNKQLYIKISNSDGLFFGKKISNLLSNFRPDFCPKISNSGPIFENGVAYKKKKL